MKILVLGGTRFMGKHLVDELLREGHEVSVGSTGQTVVHYDGEVERLTLNREDRASLEAVVQGREWDIVYDMICYSPDDARLAVDLFAGKTKKYVLISSLSVYLPADHGQKEEEWSPYGYPVIGTDRHSLSYAEGKRQAEAVFADGTAFQAVMVRPPFVLGMDDYTRRLHFHVEKVMKGETIGMPAPEARVQFIRSDEAGRFLSWLKTASLTGPVNACSTGSITLSELLGLIETVTGKKAITAPEAPQENMSPYGVEQSWYMDNGKAQAAGFEFEQLDNWLPELINQLAQQLREESKL
ncbi:Nucleoside-diphosphate-sugar epimerase [Paenibacillaceae bacterium GAS479]|nr:Nucleoside-diphosphate-sugar epimerase [Paenibacillaceae bacterium GAS479]